eukprot:g7408.t1
MQLRYLKNLNPPIDGMSKVTSISWSSNTTRLATVGADKIVQLFDEQGDKQDRFSTKPADKAAARTYAVKTIEFSPDGTKLAVAQSDNIVFVYKLGTDWKDKKSICNKFQQTSSVTCLSWPAGHPNEVVFGLAEGKVKVGQLKSNKAATLYSTDSFVVSMCSGPDGNSILSGHIDGSIYRFHFETETVPRPTTTKFAMVPQCVPYALSWGYAGICAAGNDRMFTCAAFNPSGESVVLGNYNRFLVFAWHPKRSEWAEVVQREVPNLYSVTALTWRADGSRLIVGSLCGGVDMFDVCIRRSRYRGTHEFTYVSLSQVIVKSIATGHRIVLKSNVGFEIQKINIFQDRFLVANTPESILLGDLQTCRLSEIPWHSSGTEKFFFDNPTVCMIFKAGELSVVEYGCNELLACARTEFMSPHLISVRINTPDENDVYAPAMGELKVIAYLLDLMTIRVVDLVTNTTLATISHDTRIDWLELNPNGANRLIFRDKRRQLYLYDIEQQSRVTLLNYCNYVQWVPDSDVVVAQNRGQLCVWYSINAPDRVTLHEIKGDIEDIERSNGRTCVIVDEGVNMVEYELDEGLISFGSCLERGQYAKAVDLLEESVAAGASRRCREPLDEHFNLPVAERCYAVLGDVAKSRYLHKVNRLIQDHAAEVGGDGSNFYMAQAKMAMLAKQFQRAEEAAHAGTSPLVSGPTPCATSAKESRVALSALGLLAACQRCRRWTHLRREWRGQREDDENEDYFESTGGGSQSSSARQSLSMPSEASQTLTQSVQKTWLDVLSPSADELVNVDVPNHYLNISRSRPTKSVRGGPAHVHGRSKRSKQKVQWRLKQGPPLAHKNWDFPSRLRVSTGIAKRRRLEQPTGVVVRPTMERVREALFNQVTSMHLFEDRSVRVLDLFAGTGSLGIEALSRGAAECIYVDTSKECVDCCIANSWLAGFMEHEEAAKGTINDRIQAEVAPLMMVGGWALWAGRAWGVQHPTAPGPRAQVQIELHRAQVSRQPVGAVQADVLDFLEDPEKFGLVNRSFNLVMASPNFNEISYRQLCTALAKSDLIERDGLVAIEYPREIGVLPPVLCAPFDEEDDWDDVAAGVPVLHGLRTDFPVGTHVVFVRAVLNREYGSGMLAIYCKLPTGARGRAGEPRPWDIFSERERGFAVPKQAPALNE